MTGMVEKLARAIYEQRNGYGCRPWSLLPNSHKVPYLDDARAAIKVIDLEEEYRKAVREANSLKENAE